MRPIKEVYVVQHVRSDDEYADDAKFIGAYRSEMTANGAVARLKGKSGFSDHPGAFQVQRYELDKVQWTEGFVTIVHDDS
jgi:hypothetical protein